MTGETVLQYLTGGVALVVLQFLIALWISERFKAALQRETGAALEKLRWDMKVREQATKVAEYMALVRNLKTDEDFRAANQMAWELAMWLPSDVYKTLVKALVSRSADNNEHTVAIAVRKLLLDKDAGDLGPDQILHHAPGIGKKPV